LEEGINFATAKQVGYVAGLLRRCGCPEEWRLWLIGRLIGRQLHESSEELHWAEAGAIIDSILADEDEVKEAIGEMLEKALGHCVAKAQRQNGESRVVVIEQRSLFA